MLSAANFEFCYFFIGKVEIFEDQSLNPSASNSFPDSSTLTLTNTGQKIYLDTKIELKEKISQTTHKIVNYPRLSDCKTCNFMI